jgi:3-methyl-2-oxobutanoate hydroxymethyltransferase
MSAQDRPRRRRTARDIAQQKNATPIVCLTAYTAPVARALDAHVDLMLVGDSLGMVLYGMETTLGVTLDMMTAHGAAVTRASGHACVVVDLPFGSYQESPQQAFASAARVLRETGCHAVKLEGGAAMAETIAFLTARGVPVLAHVGLTPQSVQVMGGYRTQGRDPEEAERVRADARAVAEAGAFAVVVEGVVERLAKQITRDLSAPTIGIGASAACDGQILVTEDMLGLSGDFRPRFVKRYADLGAAAGEAVAAYADDVRARRFPDAAHVFDPDHGDEDGSPA